MNAIIDPENIPVVTFDALGNSALAARAELRALLAKRLLLPPRDALCCPSLCAKAA